MKLLWRSLTILILIAGGVWLWRTLHPSPEKIIRDRMQQLAHQVSFTPPESDLARLGKIAGLPRFFTAEVDVKLALRDISQRGTITPEMIQVAGNSLRQTSPRGILVEFLDINVQLSPGKESATAELTMKATTPGNRQFDVQEMKFALSKTNGLWLIYRVETVRTLK